jgi:hypothetical protein
VQNLDRALEDRVEASLLASAYDFERRSSVGGLQVDFLVYAPGGRESYVAIDVKHIPDGVLSARYLKLGNTIATAARARRVFIVTNGRSTAESSLVTNVAKVRVLREEELVPALAAEFSHETLVHGFAAAAVIALPQVFAAMPFSEDFDDVFIVGIAGAADKTHSTAYRVDYEKYSGDVVERIKAEIRRSTIVVADLTRQRPNVLYEMGFAHALEKPVVPICADDLAALPFDVRNENVLRYRMGQTTRLRDALADRLRPYLSGR